QDLFGNPHESTRTIAGTVNINFGITVTSRLRFAIGDGINSGVATLEAGNHTNAEVINAFQAAINDAGLTNKIKVKFNSAGRVELTRTETSGKARIVLQDLNGGDSLSALVGVSSGTYDGPDARSASGVARRIEVALKDYTGLNGLINSQVTTGGVLDDRLAALSKALTTAEEQLAEFEARTRSAFVQTEKALAKFQSTSQFIQQRLGGQSGSGSGGLSLGG
ncbi:MAG: hypothetical protein ABI743_13640, partial [bacterium]